MPIQTSLAEEIAAIRRLCKVQWSLSPSETLTTSPEFNGTVTGFFNKALGLKDSKDPLVKHANRVRRCRVLQLFIGREIHSFKMLTHYECRVLVDMLKANTEDGKLRPSGHAMELIRWGDEYLEDNTSTFMDNLDEEPEPEMQEATSLPTANGRPTSPADLW